MTEEIWKPIEGYDHPYEVSNLGNVRGPHGLIGGHDSGTAAIVSLIRCRGTYTVRIHSLVARAFVPNPEGRPYVRHKDGDRMNCRADNLEWYSKADRTKAQKKPKPKKPPKCPTNCVHNGYWDTDTRFCAYLLNTGHCRPCPAGPGCTEYVAKKNAWRGHEHKAEPRKEVKHEETESNAGSGRVYAHQSAPGGCRTRFVQHR